MSRWALLIGIDYYPYRPLKGCVNDIEIIQQYMEGNTPKDQISVLTASTPGQHDSKQPIENPSSWPTIPNITSCLSNIISLASAGDQVYIHYSGHGDRLLSPSRPNTSKYVSTEHHVALVVMQEDATNVDYFEGTRFAEYLERMTEKGLLVTIILDCCFSGHVYREDCESNGAVRTFVRASDQGQNPALTKRSAGPPDIFRDAKVLPDWIINPDGYLIITACGPHELAREKEIDGMRHGVFSYHLYQILNFIKHQGGHISYQSLLNHLVTKVHSRSYQTPMSYGNLHRYFFEGVFSDSSTDFVSISTRGGQLVLEAGLAHGVCQGDSYAVYLFNTSENAGGELANNLLTAEVSSVRPLTSIMKHNTSDESTILGAYGLKARLIASKSSRRPRVGLTGDIHDKGRWIRAAMNQPFLQLSEEETVNGPYDFFVHSQANDHFIVLDADSQPVVGLPRLPAGPDQDLGPAIDALSHLSKFKYFEGIPSQDPEPALPSKFTLELKDHSGTKYDLKSVIEVVDGKELTLVIENTDESSTLYVTILNFDPLWKVHCLTADANNVGPCVIPPEDKKQNFAGKDYVLWDMQVPEECRPKGQCEDIIKVIVSSQSTSFHNLLLPRITEHLKIPARGNQTPTTATSRGSIYRQFQPPDHEEEVVIITFRVKTVCA